MISLAHCVAHVSAEPAVSQLAGGAAASSLAEACSEGGLPAACLAAPPALLSHERGRFGTRGRAKVSPRPKAGGVAPMFGSTLLWQVLSKYFAPTCSG